MKNLTTLFRILSAIVLLQLFMVISMKADSTHHTEDYARYAVGVLKGIFCDYSDEEAVNILRDAAEKDTMAYAMNALGLIYLNGIGIPKDISKSIYWLEEAGNHGVADAFHNLGAIYKEGKYGVGQDFVKAYNAFLKGAQMESRVCCYDAGYMLYKGLGCEQNYSKSIELFEDAARKGHGGAMYMLGLCYRNGYGTTQDEDKGMEIISKAADLGYSAAMEELQRPYPENCLHDVLMSDNDEAQVPPCMPEINSNLNDTTLFRGNYAGFLITYDWSGKYILAEKPVTMSVKRRGNEIFGEISIGEDKIPFTADIQADGTLQYKKSYADLKERYTKNGKVRYRLDYAKLDIWKDKIMGKISIYSLSHREPEKPMYIELSRKDCQIPTGGGIDGFNQIIVSPNPFSSQLRAILELVESSNVSIRIFDKYGVVVWQQNMGYMEKGKHTLHLLPNLTNGYYIMNISAGKQVMRTIIINEGGK